MCDGTPCPCNLVEPTPEQTAARRERRVGLALTLLAAGGAGATMLVVCALAYVLTDAAWLDLAGQVITACVLLAFAGALAVTLTLASVPTAVRERHERALAAARAVDTPTVLRPGHDCAADGCYGPPRFTTRKIRPGDIATRRIGSGES